MSLLFEIITNSIIFLVVVVITVTADKGKQKQLDILEQRWEERWQENPYYY